MIGALGWPGLVAIGIGVLVVIAIARLWPRFSCWSRDRRECHELARGNGLDGEQAALAWRLARLLSPALPLAVFVRPSLWDLAVARVGATPEAVAGIRARLFGSGRDQNAKVTSSALLIDSPSGAPPSRTSP